MRYTRSSYNALDAVKANLLRGVIETTHRASTFPSPGGGSPPTITISGDDRCARCTHWRSHHNQKHGCKVAISGEGKPAEFCSCERFEVRA